MTDGKVSAHPRGCCCFCGNGKLSREHVWPGWAAELLPKSEGNVHFTLKQRRGGPAEKVRESDRQGSITGARLRVVCRGCNSGWMSKQEELVRPHLTRLIRGEPLLFNRTARVEVRNWIVMKLMVLDSGSREDTVFLPSERRAFFEEGVVPSNLAIWLFRCGDDIWRIAYRAHARTVSHTKRKPNPAPNLKQFTWGLGSLLVVAFYQREVDIGIELEDSHGVRLWPDPGMIPRWPRGKRLMDADAEKLARSLEGMDRLHGVRWAPKGA